MKQGRGHIVQRKQGIPNIAVMIFSLAGLVAVITLVTLLIPAAKDYFDKSTVANNNRTWLTGGWTDRERGSEEIGFLVSLLSDNGIKVAYVQTNRFHGETGEFIELPYALEFLQRFRNYTDEIGLYIWIETQPQQLLNPDDRKQVADFAVRGLTELGYDGIHLQAKSVPNNSEDFILFLRELRAAIGPRAILSITVPPDRTPVDPDIPSSPISDNDLTWSQEYKRRVALNVNEIVLMAHASGFTDSQDYQLWLAYQVASYAQIIDSLDINMSYVIALPTYGAEIAHDPEVENTETAIAGILDGIARARSSGDEVDGVGLYPWEETSAPELNTYWEQWVKRRK